MKKLYTFIFSSLVVIAASANKITIGVSNFQFTPSVANALCGDTIIWAWASGSHTTTSTTIPGCATSWNANLNSTNITYSITVPCAGTYSYQCTPHAASGMKGTIVVTCANAVPFINLDLVSISYPNPFSNKVVIEAPAADMIMLYNAVGEKIKTIALPKGQIKTEINTSDITEGIYFYAILKEGTVIETKKIIKQ
jgi:plastocyanin